jgi:hypothetical protein
VSTAFPAILIYSSSVCIAFYGFISLETTRLIRLINYAKIAIYFAYAHNISENIFSHKIGGASDEQNQTSLFCSWIKPAAPRKN